MTGKVTYSQCLECFIGEETLDVVEGPTCCKCKKRACTNK